MFKLRNLQWLISLILVATSTSVAEAFTIYTEDFNDPIDQGQGAIGITSSPANTEPPSVVLGEVDWTIENISSAVGLSTSQQNSDEMANLTAATDFFQVNNNRFEAQDLDGVAIWQSPVIDISGFSDVNFSIDFSEFGILEETGGNGSLDFVDVEYIVDGVAVTLDNQNGFLGDPNFEQHTLLGDFDSQTISQTGLSGNNLQLVVSIQNWSGAELTVFDNVLVEAVPWEFSPGISLVILGMLFGGNRFLRKAKTKTN